MSLFQGMLSPPPPPVYYDHGSMVPVFILPLYLSFLAGACMAFIIYSCYVCYKGNINPSEHQHDIELGLPTTTPSQGRVQAAAKKSLTPEEQEQLAFKEVAWSVCRDKTCSICLREFEEEDECKARAECNHLFHRDCIDEWLTKRKECPLCRGYVWCTSASANS